MDLYIVQYSGPFGFIKPWTALRDGETFSQQFLTPSIVEGMRQKLEVSAIARHKLTYEGMCKQQEVIQTRGWKLKKKEKLFIRPTAILNRVVLLEPTLYLAFASYEDAQKASTQHLCLCRNEDVVFPSEAIQHLSEEAFDQLDGFELRFGENEQSFLVGYNRFEENRPMYGWLEVSNNPLKNHEEI
ncbi:MAG: hypothetical protein AAF798_05110 [Bacteroidota bacterium]